MKLKLIFIITILSFCSIHLIKAQNSMKIVGGNLKVTENVSIILKDCQLQNNGTLTATNGTIELRGTGTQLQSEIGGTGTSTLHNLKINKSSNDAQLGSSIAVNNQMELASGKLDLQSNNLTLGTNNGTLVGESETAHIYATSTGSIIKAVDLNAPNAVNAGNIGIEISSSANLGLTEIRRGHDHQTVPTGTSIFRHFTINPTNNTGLNASLNFHYLDAELNGISENALVLMEKNGGWMLNGFDSRDATNNTLSFSGYNGLYQYTLAPNVDDIDMDGITAGLDNCPTIANMNQADADNDMVGDVCDACAYGDDMIDANANNIIDDCECQASTLTLSGTLVANKNYIAGNSITSTEVINAGITSMYKAATAIILSSGFNAKTGTRFLAVSSPCQTPAALEELVVNRTTKETSPMLGQPTLAVSPNPFVQQTEIAYTVPNDGKLTLAIHDLMGQELAVLLDNQEQVKGKHSLTYNGAGLASGIYLLTMTTGQQLISEQLVMVDTQ